MDSEVQQANHSYMQESVIPSQIAESTNHTGTEENNNPCQTVDSVSQGLTAASNMPFQFVIRAPMDGNNIAAQVVNPAPTNGRNSPSEAANQNLLDECNTSSQVANQAPTHGSNILSQVIGHIPSVQDTVASVIAQKHRDPLPGQESPKPRRKRAPPKKKQTQSMQDVQEPSGQPSEAAEAETPPSTKIGTKRKKSAVTYTPAKKTTAAKKTPTTKTPSTKTPAKKRGSTTIALPAELSEGPDDGSTEGETARAVQNDVPELGMPSGSELPPAPSAEFETLQMRINQLSQAQGLLANFNQDHMSMPSPDNQQMNNQFSLGSSRPSQYNQLGQPSIYRQLEYIDRQHTNLVNTLRQLGSNRAAALAVQHRIAQLVMSRNQLLGMNYGPMYQPINGCLPNNQMHPMPPYNGFDPGSQMFASPQIYASSYNSHQSSGIFQNNGSNQNLSHTLAQQWDNHSLGNDPSIALSLPGGYQTAMVTPSTDSWEIAGAGTMNQASQFQHEPQVTTSYASGSAMPNMNTTPGNVPRGPEQYYSQSTTPPIHSLAAWPQEDVQRARSSVQSTLGIPVSGQASNYGSVQDTIDPELRNS
jgi:hypothetical protein